jgi:hypothetical protein
MRKVLTLTARLCEKINDKRWRQSKHILRKVKKMERKAQNMKRSNARNEEQKIIRENLIKEAHEIYIKECERILERVKKDIKEISIKRIESIFRIEKIKHFICHAEKQIDLIRRRVLNGEVIPHGEKIFSIFEEHTEWICKGKAGILQELGLKVCVLEDNFGFILNHRIMINETDEKVAVPIVEETKEIFHNLRSCSFDKGFHNKINKEELLKIVDIVVLPMKGRQSIKEKEEMGKPENKKLRRKHSAVESGISALENHGLDRCPDRGLERFKIYVGLAILSRNIQQLGRILLEKEKKREERKLLQDKSVA